MDGKTKIMTPAQERREKIYRAVYKDFSKMIDNSKNSKMEIVYRLSKKYLICESTVRRIIKQQGVHQS